MSILYVHMMLKQPLFRIIFTILQRSTSIRKKVFCNLQFMLFFLCEQPLIFLEPWIFWEWKDSNYLVNVALTIRPNCFLRLLATLEIFLIPGYLSNRFSLLCLHDSLSFVITGQSRSTLKSDNALSGIWRSCFRQVTFMRVEPS